jgi:hypothetical protein
VSQAAIPANSNAHNVPYFRRWRFEMKLGPFFSKQEITFELLEVVLLIIYHMNEYKRCGQNTQTVSSDSERRPTLTISLSDTT